MPLTRIVQAVRFVVASVESAVSPTLSALAFTPTHIFEANALVDGANDSRLDVSGNTYASSLHSASDYGTKCYSMSIDEGETGYGNWGCGFEYPTNLVKGESIHCQFSLYFPEDFDWTAPGEGGRLKLFRLHTQSSVGANEGYNDMLMENTSFWGESRDGGLYHAIEIPWSGATEIDENVVKGVWETFEYRVDYDDVPLDSGGIGRTRIWRNKSGVMTLIADRQTNKH